LVTGLKTRLCEIALNRHSTQVKRCIQDIKEIIALMSTNIGF